MGRIHFRSFIRLLVVNQNNFFDPNRILIARLTQWGHSPLEVPDDNDDIISKAQIGADEIKRVYGI